MPAMLQFTRDLASDTSNLSSWGYEIRSIILFSLCIGYTSNDHLYMETYMKIYILRWLIPIYSLPKIAILSVQYQALCLRVIISQVVAEISQIYKVVN
jgi:hypothetical protein